MTITGRLGFRYLAAYYHFIHSLIPRVLGKRLTARFQGWRSRLYAPVYAFLTTMSDSLLGVTRPLWCHTSQVWHLHIHLSVVCTSIGSWQFRRAWLFFRSFKSVKNNQKTLCIWLNIIWKIIALRIFHGMVALTLACSKKTPCVIGTWMISSRRDVYLT